VNLPQGVRDAIDSVRGPWISLRKRLTLRRARLWFTFVFALLGRSRERRRDPRLSVAVDVTPLWESLSGIGWYLDRLLREFHQHPDVVFRLYGPTVIGTDDIPRPVVTLPAAANVEWVLATPPHGMWFTTPTVKFLRRIQPVLIALDGNRLFFAPNFFLPRRLRFARRVRRARLVATIHDLGWRRVPWTLSDATRQNLEQHVPQVLETAARLITPSEAVRAELAEAGVAALRVVAIHHGPGQLAETAAPATPESTSLPRPTDETAERFALFVGTLEPRKGVDTVLEAWRRFRTSGGKPPTLVLVGRWGWKSDELRDAAAIAEAEGWCRVAGYVDAAELARLYHRATMVVLPSIYEGFGLPLLEGMFAGAPILASDLPVTREVAGDAALYAPAGNAAAWCDALERFEREPDLARALSASGRERAATFRWSDAAARTVATFRTAAEDPS
jgi:glycosyltransferase involved in cell wall biosynthesis